MDLVVFDLDGTLLDRDSAVSARTAETLRLLADRGIAYTVATGRMLHGSRDVLAGHGFDLPQIFKNGVMVWNPLAQDYSHLSLLAPDEIRHVMDAVTAQQVTPFVFTLEAGNQHAVYHAPVQNAVEERLLNYYIKHPSISIRPVSELPAAATITNISAIGPHPLVAEIERIVTHEEHLVAFAGSAMEGEHLAWIDIHHSVASKGNAVRRLRRLSMAGSASLVPASSRCRPMLPRSSGASFCCSVLNGTEAYTVMPSARSISSAS